MLKLLPVIFGLAAGLIKTFNSRGAHVKRTSTTRPKTKNIGPVALWGVPNSGKTTFVNRLLGNAHSEIKTQTTHIKKYENLEFPSSGTNYIIEKIYDMPGVNTRKSEWLGHVRGSKNSIYLINLEKYFDSNENYSHIVQQHLKELSHELINNKSINLMIIGTHLDKTEFSKSNEPNNLIQQSSEFHKVIASLQDLTIWFYSVNLLDDNSCKTLIESIVGDIDAKS